MDVLVTGSDGYIGSVLTSILRQRGHRVAGVDTGFYDSPPLLPRDELDGGTLRLDVRRLTPERLAGFDAVVHLAELSNDPLAELSPELTHEINRAGSVHVAAVAKEAGVPRFVYASSCSVYGVVEHGAATEESPLRPQTTYAACKALVERDVAALADERFSPVFLRNATAYGASPCLRLDLVLNNLAGSAWARGEILVTSDGTPWRPLVHVRDIGAAIACSLEAPREAVHGEIFNVGADEDNHTVREIAEVVAGVFAGCPVTIGGAGGPDARSYRVSFRKARERLPGFECAWNAADGARELLDLFRAVDLPRDAIESPRYTRLARIRGLLESGELDGRLYWRQACVSTS